MDLEKLSDVLSKKAMKKLNMGENNLEKKSGCIYFNSHKSLPHR